MIPDCPQCTTGPYKVTTAAGYRAQEIEEWTNATFMRGLLLRNVPDEYRKFVTDLRNQRLSLVSAIAKIEPEKAA